MLTQEKIKELEKNGFSRWTKGNYDRLYINPRDFGLEVEYYKTGNIRSGQLAGISLSNAESRRILGGKYYVDVKSGELVLTTTADHRDMIEGIIKKMMAEGSNDRG